MVWPTMDVVSFAHRPHELASPSGVKGTPKLSERYLPIKYPSALFWDEWNHDRIIFCVSDYN